MSAPCCCEIQAPEPWAAMEQLSSQTMSGGYDLNLFTTPPDCNFLCSVCHGVLKRPVRLPCSHIFCQKCILRWKEVKRRKMVHVNQLRKTIGRLEVKCKNAEAGCLVTCPLAHRKGHQDTCPFELQACPNEGCNARVPRGSLAEHRQHCQRGARQRCPLGCGAILGPAERARHNCYRELREAWGERQARSRGLLRSLLRRVRRVHRTTDLLRRQLAQLGNFLDEDDAVLLRAGQEAEAPSDSSVVAGAWGAHSQDVL
ncbi:RING finger protein 151 isoform 3-T3 [Thomomys bottae]